jgi:hypothetical protein
MRIKQKDKDLGLTKILGNIKKIGKKRIKAQYGFFDEISIQKASKFEFGGHYSGEWHGYVPPRPIFGPEFANNLPYYEKQGKEINDTFLSGADVPNAVSERIGKIGKQNIVKRIRDLNSDPSIPKLHPATVNRKGNNIIGIDTGDFITKPASKTIIKNPMKE